jgi:hypothetical protein
MSNLFKIQPVLEHLVHTVEHDSTYRHPSTAADTMIGPVLLSMTRHIRPYIRVQATLSHPAQGQALKEMLVPATLALVIQYRYEMYIPITGDRDRMAQYFSNIFLNTSSFL